jgi:hypothetical protein
MRDLRWILLLLVGALVPVACLADEAATSGKENKTLPAEIVVLDQLAYRAKYPSRWRLSFPIEDMAYSNATPQPITHFVFQDVDTFSRVSKYRHLSLLTLAEFDQKRLFLGVNEKGLLGLHYSAVVGAGSDRYLELLRMPYLRSDEFGR